MKISFAITVHNEGHYVESLLETLILNCANTLTPDDFEIVILDDYSDDPKTKEVLEKAKAAGIMVRYHPLNNNFAEQKNYLNSLCSGEYIFQIDADEMIAPEFFDNLIAILDANTEIEAFYIPRVNTVQGLTKEHVKKWNWTVMKMEQFRTISNIALNSPEYELLRYYGLLIKEEDGKVEHYLPVIQWPDFQMRLYKNKPEIKWEKPVHETLTGFTSYSIFPVDVSCALWHHKNIKRQELQNEFYEKLM